MEPLTQISKLEENFTKLNERFDKMGRVVMDLSKPEPPRLIIRPHSSSQTNELDAAHSKSLSRLRCVPKDNKGAFGKYAKVEQVADYVNPILSDFGLSIKQLISYTETGEDLLITRLSHASGQWIESHTILKRELGQKSPNQLFGSSITYARRYAFLAILGIGATDDPVDAIE